VDLVFRARKQEETNRGNKGDKLEFWSIQNSGTLRRTDFCICGS